MVGGDKIRARHMKQDFFEFDPSHLLVMVTNHLPKVTRDDPALWDRLRVIPFTVTITKPDCVLDLQDSNLSW